MSNSPGLDARAETFVLRLSTYALKVGECNAQLRRFYSSEQIKQNYPAARQEWDNLRPSQDPPIESPAWKELWKTIDAVLASNPTNAKELLLRGIVGMFAMGLVFERELLNDPLKAQIRDAAEKRTMMLLKNEGDNTSGVKPKKAADLIGYNIRYTDNLGCQLEFVITDYGTSHSDGSWVKYLPKNGREGTDEIVVAVDKMDDMLERAEVLP